MNWLAATLLLASASSLLANEPIPRPLLMSGEVIALDAQEIIVPASTSSPVVLRTYVADGQTVKAGDTVLAIDPGGQATQVTSLTTQLEQARAKVERESADLEVVAINAELALALSAANLAKAEIDAALPKQFISALDFDRYQGERDRARYDLQVKQSERDNARAAVARRLEDGALEIRKLNLGLAFAQAQIASSTVLAKHDGVVVHGFSPWRGRRFDEGESGFPGASVGQVIGATGLSVRTWVLEADRHQLEAGLPVSIQFDAVPGLVLESRIDQISSAPEARAAWGEGRYFRLDLVLPSPVHEAIAPGMSALVQPLSQQRAAKAAALPPAVRQLKLDGELVAQRVTAISPPGIQDVWNYNLVMLSPEGVLVQAGQPVAIFDAADIGSRLPQKESQLAEKSTQLQKLLLDHAEAKKAADLAVTEAQSGLDKAKRKADQPADTIRRIDYDKLIIDRKLAEQNARLATEKRDAQTRARSAELAQLNADIGLLESEIADLKKARGELTVLAQATGVVSHRSQFNGEKFAVGTTVFKGLAVAEVADPTSIVVMAVVAEPEAHAVRVGQSGRVAIAGGNTVLQAKVVQLGRVYRTKSRNQPVIVRDVQLAFDANPETLKPGATVTVTLDVSGPAAGAKR